MIINTVLPPTSCQKGGIFYGYIIVLVAFFVMVIMAGILHSFGVFIKPISAEFGWSRAMISGVYATSLFVIGVLFLLTGRLNDRFGPRILITACGLLLGLGIVLIYKVSALWQLYLFWGVIATMGFSGGLVPMASTVARWFDKRRGIMTGIVLGGVGAGQAIVAPLSTWLISEYGWRTTFIIIGSAAFVLLLLAANFLKRDPSLIGQLPYGQNEVEQEASLSGARGIGFREAILTRQFWIICIMFLFFGACFHTLLVHTIPHATKVGLTPIVAASVLTVNGGLNIVGRIVMGSISDRIGTKPSLLIGLALMSISLFLLLAARDIWMFYLFAIVFGLGGGGLVALQSLVTAKLFGLKAHGVILGAIVFSVTTGGSIGALLAGHIFDLTNSYYLAFLALAILAIISLILATLYRPSRQKGIW